MSQYGVCNITALCLIGDMSLHELMTAHSTETYVIMLQVNNHNIM